MNKNIYLERYALPQTLIQEPAHDDLFMCVVIPSYKEPNLIKSLEALYSCSSTKHSVEVIVVINEPEGLEDDAKNINEESYSLAKEFSKTHSTDKLKFHIIYANPMPKKHAGVGLARKIGMDEAVRRLESVGKSNGIIDCFDADSECANNYLQAIESHFLQHPKSPACSIHFEHPLDGPLDNAIYQGITAYELHLRYYVHAMRYSGHPHAFQTIGSSMAVRCDSYQKQGGMNRRKAGEDFYFLHKFIPLGNFTEIKNTQVTPSPRPSDRVPFGTGRAIGEYLDKKKDVNYTYNWESFEDLKKFYSSLDNIYTAEENELNDIYQNFPDSIKAFLPFESFSFEIAEIKKYSSNQTLFIDKFYKWFNGFKVLKFVHFARDHFHENQTLTEACDMLFEKSLSLNKLSNNKEYLIRIREIDKS
ncbi:glycosyltransferase [Aureibacter tunicatorum]|uniref:Glycosyl transferase family 2 n=1 Tax=Aureibacter tunicatorum TaxID=866807 RepID=A0AAE3XPT3_9BACT|nr:hypothetical protein [Aureibacter tunicatorum]MDR6239819.1 hypothetical protein [Aureibacter tunicatorum]BDD04294.1 hypothetical protein AUTU_17770 [Aureibacter tunicatorum]